MSANSFQKANIQVAAITVIAALYAGVMLPSLAGWKDSERDSTSVLSERLSQPDASAGLRPASGGFDGALFARGKGRIGPREQARAEIAR